MGDPSAARLLEERYKGCRGGSGSSFGIRRCTLLSLGARAVVQVQYGNKFTNNYVHELVASCRTGTQEEDGV